MKLFQYCSGEIREVVERQMRVRGSTPHPYYNFPNFELTWLHFEPTSSAASRSLIQPTFHIHQTSPTHLLTVLWAPFVR
jgi:hypothetical protein